MQTQTQSPQKRAAVGRKVRALNAKCKSVATQTRGLRMIAAAQFSTKVVKPTYKLDRHGRKCRVFTAEDPVTPEIMCGFYYTHKRAVHVEDLLEELGQDNFRWLRNGGYIRPLPLPGGRLSKSTWIFTEAGRDRYTKPSHPVCIQGVPVLYAPTPTEDEIATWKGYGS